MSQKLYPENANPTGNVGSWLLPRGETKATLLKRPQTSVLSASQTEKNVQKLGESHIQLTLDPHDKPESALDMDCWLRSRASDTTMSLAPYMPNVYARFITYAVMHPSSLVNKVNGTRALNADSPTMKSNHINVVTEMQRTTPPIVQKVCIAINDSNVKGITAGLPTTINKANNIPVDKNVFICNAL